MTTKAKTPPTSPPPEPTELSPSRPDTAIVAVSQIAHRWNAIGNLAEAIQIAELVAKSAVIPDVRNAGVALLKMMAGAELGFGCFASLVDVHIIEGKPSIGAHLKAAAIKRSGKYRYKVIVSTKEECNLEFSEKIDGVWEVLGNVSLTMAEAIETGLAVKDVLKSGEIVLKRNWRVSGKDMLFARCISQGYRQHAPDLTGGVLTYDPDELEGGVDPVQIASLSAAVEPQKAEKNTGEVIDAEYTVNGHQEQPESPAPVMVNSDQINTINVMLEDQKLTPEQIQKAFKARGVETVEGLTSEQAREMIESLRKRSREMQKTSPAPATATT